MIRISLAVIVLLASSAAQALNVFACEPEWASLARELAGETATITSATSAFQDPHRVQARPSLIAAIRNADILVCTGADLEIGWLPLLLRRAGNAKIQPGNPGHFLAASHVRRIEIPVSVDRSQGDVHPQGNPHIHLDPRNIERVAKALTEALLAVDASNSAGYQQARDDFLGRWRSARAAWDARGKALQGMRLAAHTASFSYLAAWLKLDIVGTLETKPGIPPSGAQLAELLERLSPAPPLAVVRTPYENEKPSHWLSQRLNIPELVLPFTVGGTETATDLFSLYDETLGMLETLRP
jgi:zinc/manganese transport system substrate-binding protein